MLRDSRAGKRGACPRCIAPERITVSIYNPFATFADWWRLSLHVQEVWVSGHADARRIAELQRERFATLVDHAREHSAFYRRRYAHVGPGTPVPPPAGPVGPVTPVKPAGPVGPVGPVTPGEPWKSWNISVMTMSENGLRPHFGPKY